MSNEYTNTADQMLRRYGYNRARVENSRSRDQNSWGTFSHGWHVQVGKEIERLHREQPDKYKP